MPDERASANARIRVTNETPPFDSSFEALEEGQSVEQSVTISEPNLKAFAELSQDSARVHHDPEFARSKGYEAPIVYGFQLASYFSRLLGMYLPGENSVIQSVELRYLQPVMLGQELTFTVTVRKVVGAVGAVVLELAAMKGDTPAVKGKAQCVFPRAT